MSRPRPVRGSIGTAVLVAGLVAAVPATAGAAAHATTPASASTITLDAAFRKALRADRVTLKASRPATLKGTKLRLPVTRSTTAKGTTTLTHGGSLTLRRGSRSTVAGSWRTVVRARTATVSALIAKRRVGLLTITGGRIRADRTTGAVTVSGGRVALTRAGAKALRGRLRGSRLKARTVGRVATTVAPKPAAPPAPAPVPTPPTAPTAPTAPETPTPPTTPTVPTTPTEPADVACPLPAADATPVTGSSTWNLRESWVTYLYNPAWGTGNGVFGTDGAERTTAGQDVSWRYPRASVSTTAAGETIIAHTGQLRFLVVSHGIDTRIANPRIIVAADGQHARLCADGTGSGTMTTPGATAFENVQLLDIDLAAAGESSGEGEERVWEDAPATVAQNDDAVSILSYERGEPWGSLDVGLPTGG